MKLTVAGVVVVAMMLVGNGFAQTAPASAPTAPADKLTVNPIPPDVQAEEANLIRSKIERAGYTEISVLSRDSWGVWRGRAKKGDETVNVVVDKGGRIKSEPR